MYNEIGEIWLIHVNAMAKVFGKFIGAALAVMAVIWVGTGQALAQLHSDEDLGVYKQTEVFRQGDLDLDGRFTALDVLHNMGVFLAGYDAPPDLRSVDFNRDGVYDIHDMGEGLEVMWPVGIYNPAWEWVGDYPYDGDMVPPKNIWRIDRGEGNKEYCFVEIRVIDRTSLQPVANPYIKIGNNPTEMGDDQGVLQTEVELDSEGLDFRIDDDDEPGIGSYFAIDTTLNVPFNSVVVVPLIRNVATTTSQQFSNTMEMAADFFVGGVDQLIDKDFANEGKPEWGILPFGLQLDDHYLRDPNGVYQQVDLSLGEMRKDVGLFGIYENVWNSNQFTPLQIEKLNKKMADINYWIVEDILQHFNPSEQQILLVKPLFLRRDITTNPRPDPGFYLYEGRFIYPDGDYNSATHFQGNIIYGVVSFNVYTTLQQNTMDHEFMNSLIGVRVAPDQPTDFGSCASQSGRVMTDDDKQVIQIGYAPITYKGLDGKGIKPMKEGYFDRIMIE